MHKAHVITLAKIKIRAAGVLNVRLEDVNLIVCYISQKKLEELKPRAKGLSSECERKEELLSLGFVDEVIVQNGIEDLPKIVNYLNTVDKNILLFFQGPDQKNERFSTALSKVCWGHEMIQPIERAECYFFDDSNSKSTFASPSTSLIYKKYKNQEKKLEKSLKEIRTEMNKKILPIFEDYKMLMLFKEIGFLKEDVNQVNTIAIPTRKEVYSTIQKYDLAISDSQKSELFNKILPQPLYIKLYVRRNSI